MQAICYTKKIFLEEKQKDRFTIGILMMIIATICFSIMMVIVKYLRHLPLMEIILFRNIPIMIVVSIILKNKGIFFYGYNRSLLLLGSLFNTFSVIAYFYTITTMTLAAAVSIKQLSPFFILILASIFLGEKINNKKIIIFIIAFLGAMLIAKPGFNLAIYPVIIGLSGAVLTGLSHISVRRLRLTDHQFVIINYIGFTEGIMAFGILFWQGNFYIPDIRCLFILLLMGLVSFIAQFTFTKAYQMAPVKLVSLYLYLQIIFGTFFGILFFKEYPDIFSIFGVLLIIVCGYLNFRYTKEERNNGSEKQSI